MSLSAKETRNSCFILSSNEVKIISNLAEVFGVHPQRLCVIEPIHSVRPHAD